MAAAAVRDVLCADGVMAILRYPQGGDVAGALTGLADGGLRVAEVTVTTPGAWATIETAAGSSGLLLGAGTVTTTSQVRRVADVGGVFVVSPGFDPEVVAAALELGLEPLPGVASATEVLAARRAGARLLKLFPAGALGVRYLRELRGPFPAEGFVPTGGVAVGDIAAWLAAGAVAVALGSDLAGRAAPTSAAEVRVLAQRARAALSGAAGSRADAGQRVGR